MAINGYELARMTDSTAVGTLATLADVNEMIAQAKQYHFFAINGPASYFLKLVEDLKGTDTNPNFGCTRWSGADPTHVKCYAAKWAVDHGAKEIDMVMNQSYLVSKLYREAEDDIRAVKETIGPNVALKVIIECPLHTDAIITDASKIIVASGADAIKTCTGMEGPCTEHYVEVIKKAIGDQVWIKAAGGIRTLETVDNLVDLGVARFGIGYKHAKKLCDAANHR